MEGSRFVVGIDLGTTNTALAYVDTQANPLAIAVLPIDQLTSPGQVGERDILPSFIYSPGPHELPAGSLTLPWNDQRTWAVGEMARDHGAKVGHRLVASAKSWLCHPGVDRRAAILPWGGGAGAGTTEDVSLISPLEASRRIIEHVREAWNHRMTVDDPHLALEKQTVVLTVPASFDAVARELTVEAARDAGLGSVTLLEEPQAAFYAWLEANPDHWREQVRVGEIALVCDVGGGTTDFCLISVADVEGNVELTRVAVGDHLLLGGDNMDLALALAVESELKETGKTLDAWQLGVLIHQCRIAKEQLLEKEGKAEAGLVIPGRGSSVVGGTIKAKLARASLDEVVVEGFFPECEATEHPQTEAQVGIAELGLPYAPDARITRWLARFLCDHAAAVDGGSKVGYVTPAAVLFNGGVLRPAFLRERIRAQVQRWAGAGGIDSVRELASPDPTLAVARGAAYYGCVRRGKGVRIRGGAARSYYIGIEAARPAVPGVPAPLRAMCVMPRGTEEGTSLDLPRREFALVVGQTARFRFFASTTRADDTLGAVVNQPETELTEIDPLTASLPAGEAQGRVPVKLRSSLTEVGTLELGFVERNDQKTWKLEFSVREKPKAPATAPASASASASAAKTKAAKKDR